MTAMTDKELLRQYADTGAEEAFAGLFAQHGDWIYSAARRMVRRSDWAEDVTQAVFLLLARRAGSIKPASLNSWLFNSTRYCSLSLLRSERRREKREKQAAIMIRQSSDVDKEALWVGIAPRLEDAVRRLNDEDRQAILLRFYQRKAMAEIGSTLGISDEAARKRVAKAIQRLRALLSARGVSAPAAAVAVILDQKTAQAAPQGLASACTSGTPAMAALHIIKGVDQMLFAFKIKLMAAVLLLAAIPSGVWLAAHAAIGGQVVEPNPPAVAAEMNPTTAPAAAAEASGDDVSLAPFLNSFTQIIFSVDLRKIDPNKLDAQERSVLLSVLSPGDVRREAVQRATADARNAPNHWFTTLKNAGVRQIDPVIAGPPDSDLAGFFVLPGGSSANLAMANMSALDNMFQSTGVDSPNGQARIYGGKRSVPVQTFITEMEAADSRPELLEGLSAGPDQAVRIVLLPRILDHTGGSGRILGLGNFSDPQWQTVKWCRLGLDMSPALALRATLECQDGASAAGMLAEKFAARAKAPPSDPLEARIAGLLGTVQPAADGSRVIIRFDEPMTETLLAVWYWRDLEGHGSLGNLAIARTTAPPDPNLPHFTADQLQPLIGAVGKTVIVEGTAWKTGPMEPRVNSLQFEGVGADGFFAAADQEHAPDGYEFFGSVDGSRLAHKKIRITGVVYLYKGRPMILLSDLKQMELVTGTGGN
jgi:RNA polymerase sigma factor (sigma-70 family)